MIYKILTQSDLYHNPDPLCRLVGEVNETTVAGRGPRGQSSYRLWFSVVIYFTGMGKEIESKIATTLVLYCKLKVWED